jgi:mannosyl-oligosaccharide alpha-1,2-mannosidase
MLALGVHTGVTGSDKQLREEHLTLAKDLMYTCYQFYARMGTGLSPELVMFEEGVHDFKAGDGAHHNLLRPETVESLMYMYRVTGDSKYQDWGWEMFQAWEKHSKVASGGYACLVDVTVGDGQLVEKKDKMESFWLAETLKYLYLLFSPPSVMPLEEWLFNTEAHPLRMTIDHPPRG